MDHDTREGLKYVEAVLNYLVDTGEKPVIYLYPPPPGIPQRTGRYTTSTVPICDGRALLPQLSLDKQGFLLQRHETRVVNFYDEHEVQAVYYPEVERLVQAVTGAAKVVVFDHTWRCALAAKRAEHGAQEPVRVPAAAPPPHPRLTGLADGQSPAFCLGREEGTQELLGRSTSGAAVA